MIVLITTLPSTVTKCSKAVFRSVCMLSVPEPKRLQRVHGGLGAADVLPVLPVVAEQHQTGGPMHGPVLRASHLLRGFGVQHTLRGPQSGGTHMRHDEQPLDAQTAQDHRWVSSNIITILL